MSNFDWKRLGLSVVCVIVLIAGFAAFKALFPTACVVVTCVALFALLVFAFYLVFGDVQDYYNGED
jgi:hypothetical protein